MSNYENFYELTRKDGHGSPVFYAIIGFVLAIITLVEFLIFYVESLGVLLIPIMLVLSLMKFVIVVAFFMHLRFDNKIFTYLFFAGFMTLIPLFMYIKGFELIGIGPASMIFFLTPTAQFFLSIFYLGQSLNIEKLTSFILIWIAVIIYLNELRKE